MHIESQDGTRLYVKDWGEGKPVILIHGWPLSADSWDHIALGLLNAGFRVIAYDRRGFGRSDQPGEGYDYDTFADDLAAVIKATGVADAAVVGFSMGGGEVARYMSLHQGKHIRKAVLVSSVVPFMLETNDNPDGVPAEVFNGMKDGINAERPKFFANFFKDFYGVGFLSHPVSDAYLDWSRSVAMQASLKATLDCVDAFGRTDFRTDLDSFKVPTLLIHGTKDDIVPIDISSKKAQAGIKEATLIEYEGSPHGLLATDQQRLIDDLVKFLQH